MSFILESLKFFNNKLFAKIRRFFPQAKMLNSATVLTDNEKPISRRVNYSKREDQ